MSEPGNTNPRRLQSAVILSMVTTRDFSAVLIDSVSPDPATARKSAIGTVLGAKRPYQRSCATQRDLGCQRLVEIVTALEIRGRCTADSRLASRHPPIDLSRGDTDVPKKLLHLTQVRAPSQRVRGECVPQRMGRDLSNLSLVGIGLQDQPESLSCQAATAVVEEQGAFFPKGEQRPRLEQVVIDRLDCAVPQWQQPLPSGAPGATHAPLQQIHVFAVEG